MLSTVGTLEGIGRLISDCTDLFVHLVVEMLDPRSRREWETSIAPRAEDYEEGRAVCNVLGRPLHTLLQRLPKEAAEREEEFVEAKQLCLNCFGRHQLADCQSKKTCAACNAKHHSSTHDAYVPSGNSSTAASTSLHVQRRTDDRATVLLATARVDIADKYGTKFRVRALIDSGSEVSLITEALAQRLRLQRTAGSVTILGIGGQRTVSANGRVKVLLSSRATDFAMQLTALVLLRISAYGARVKMAGGEWLHVRGLQLADPDFQAANPVEFLLEADGFFQIIEDGLRKGGPRTPIAQKMTLGWIFSTLVGRFWEQEELPQTPLPLTEDEQRCEDLLVNTHTRTTEGRYVVRLPVTPTLPALADTRRASLRLLRCMERRFTVDQELQRLYKAFMAEYQELHHMSPAEPVTDDRKELCYLPHHGVLKRLSSSSERISSSNSSDKLGPSC
ncbi:hypothetical protein RF55_11988 [Lasius niger]|uniref:Peptidase A2 domain-containing protein n=1 Tax=Lasius niger TaxID=67767 RepID=A0A0J7KDH9_LASNI|nr:hypothetical protein RF55_11988 [Lasius niger]